MSHRVSARVTEVCEAIPLFKREGVGDEARKRTHAFEEAPLHTMERHMKLPVDLGMFFFGLANAGVELGAVGGITTAILTALIVGKTLGIALFALAGVLFGFPLPPGITVVDLFAMAALGGVGLTVALFVSNEAFVDPGLRSQAKMGAVLSVASAGLAWSIRKTGIFFFGDQNEEDEEADDEQVTQLPDNEEWLEEMAIEDILRVLALQRKYSKRGTHLPTRETARRISKQTSKHATRAMSKTSSDPRPQAKDEGVRRNSCSGRLQGLSDARPAMEDDLKAVECI
jgi:hypothetical protein